MQNRDFVSKTAHYSVLSVEFCYQVEMVPNDELLDQLSDTLMGCFEVTVPDEGPDFQLATINSSYNKALKHQ